MSKKTRVVSIVGPTSSGKTSLGIELAFRMGGEVISADSRQVYRGLDLGTGKVATEEARGVPHHMIDVADPMTRYTVYDFVTEGRAAISDIAARGKLPIVVGGTGLYIDALLGRITLDAPPADPELRARLLLSDNDTLLEELRSADPVAYARVDLKNRRRVERALEIALSEVRPHSVAPQEYTVTWIGLTLPRDELKVRIHDRLLARLSAGMLDEARRLCDGGLSYERMEELGLEYRYMARHLQGVLTYDEMVATLESEIYKYAKRQMTWFKRNKEIDWTNPQERQVLLHILKSRCFEQ